LIIGLIRQGSDIMKNRKIDFRSDTVTRPSPEMREVIFRAEVGDDVFGDDPTLNLLQEKTAELFRKDAGLFVPSGTMSNQVALNTLSEPGWEIICERECHIVNYETGGPAVHSSLMINMLTTERGVMTAEEIEDSVRPANIHIPITKIVTIENTHNGHGGTIYPLEEIKKIRKVADKHNLLMHLDGARIWNAHVATGIPLSDWVAPFDSASVCFSKGLGAPIGSMILGSRNFIEKARRNRKLFGGAMRQVGIIASAVIYALDNNIKRLAEDHINAKLLAEGLNDIDGFDIDLSRVQTNIIIADISGTNKGSNEVSSVLEENGVLSVPFGPTKIRFVTHLDVSREECEKAIDIISGLKF